MFTSNINIQEKLGLRWPYIIRVAPKYGDVEPSIFTWMNFNKELDWCEKNCEYDFVLKIVLHDNEYKIHDCYSIGKVYKSAFFSFESHDEALIFGIKFKR